MLLNYYDFFSNNQPLGEKLIKETKHFTFHNQTNKQTHLVFGLRRVQHTSHLFPCIYDHTYDSTWKNKNKLDD